MQGSWNLWSHVALVCGLLLFGARALSAADCNGNGSLDSEDVGAGRSQDCNANGVPDECELLPLPFGLPVTVPMVAAPRVLAAADFNRDGRVDLVVSSNTGEALISILLQHASGEFSEAVYRVARSLNMITAADLDGDGAADIVALDTLGLVMLVNSGTGTFRDPVSIGVSRGHSLSTGDLDGDGAADVMVSRATRRVVTVFFTRADGTLGEPVDHDVGFTRALPAVGDLDGDGDLDVAALSPSTHGLVILWNGGGGVLSRAASVLTTLTRPRGLRLADFNGDDLVDIAVANMSSLVVAVNQGQGSFTEAVPFSIDQSFRDQVFQSSVVDTLRTGDVDGDGDTDLFLMAPGSNVVLVAPNTGNGAFGVGGYARLDGVTGGFAVQDLDGDSDHDLVVAVGPDLQILFNDGVTSVLPGTPVPMSSRATATIFEPHFSILGDADGDGDLDFTAIDGEATIMVLANDGSGVFPERTTVTVPRSIEMFALTAADLDNDGDRDLVTGDEVGNLVVLLRDQDSHQQTRHQLRGGFRFLATADLNEDGFPEIVGANSGRSVLSILPNAGDGSFLAEEAIAVGSGPVVVMTGDVDGDGHADVTVVSRGSSQLAVLFGNGAGGLPDRIEHDVNQPTFVAGGDFDNDGDVDLAVADSSGAVLFVNQGGREFLSHRIVRVNVVSSSLISVDLDGDGLLDLAGSSGTGNKVAAILNMGNNTFLTPFFYRVGVDPRYLLGGDLDADGDNDLLSANHSSRDITVLTNDSQSALVHFALEKICTELDFFRVAVPTSTGGTARWLTKYVVPADREDPDLLPTLFQNVRRHELHQEFLEAEFPEHFPTDSYDQLVGRRATRKYFVGVVYLLHTEEGPLYGFNVLASFFADSAELPRVEEVRGVYQTLREVFTIEPLAYFPDSRIAREDAKTWENPGFPVHFADLSGGTGFQAYTLGTGYGRVRVLDREAFQEANGSGRISFQDVLVLSEAPRDIEGVVGGIVTAEPQGELSHIAVRTSRRGTPNAFVANAMEAFADLEGKLIRLVVADGGYTTEEVPPEEAAAWWVENRPELSELPTVDGDYTAIDSFAEMDLSGNEVAPEARYGGKASNLARLQRILDGPFEQYREVGFSVPPHYYLEFLRSNTMSSARNAGREVTYEEFLEELVDWPEFESDSELRFDVLDDLRDHMRDRGRADGDLVARLGRRIEEVFGTTSKRVRFRSSSNIEDILEFNGAGLYDSTSACVPDDLDADTTGPSLCDTTRPDERGVERALKEVWRSLWTFRAHEERAFFGVPQDTSAMAILVSRSFPDEIANGVAFTGNPTNSRDRRYVVAAQIDEVSVVSPDPGVVAEKNLLRVEDGRVVEITRAARSSIVPLGGVVLSDAELEELGALLWHINENFPVDPGDQRREDLLLDVEFKIEPNGDLAVKQVRPFLRITPTVPAPDFELVIEEGATACGVFVQSRSPRNAYELKSTLRFSSGQFALPTDVGVFTLDLVEEVRVGPGREVAVAQGPGRIQVTSTLEGAITTYRFRYTQDFVLADGTPYEIQLTSLDFRARGDDPLEPSILIDEEYIAGELVLQGNLGLVVDYASCSREEMPLWEIVVDLEDGSRIELLERHEPPPTINDTGPASLVHASLDLAGARRDVSDYWYLVYTALRHNRSIRHWVVLEPPAELQGVDTPVRVVEIIAPPESESAMGAGVNYLDTNFVVITSPPVTSYRRERITDIGPPLFLRGDVEADGVLNVSDAVALLWHLFRGGEAPHCRKAADANDDGRVNISDAVAILHHLFRDAGTRPLPEPFGKCGVDASADDLPCTTHPACAGN